MITSPDAGAGLQATALVTQKIVFASSLSGSGTHIIFVSEVGLGLVTWALSRLSTLTPCTSCRALPSPRNGIVIVPARAASSPSVIGRPGHAASSTGDGWFAPIRARSSC
jgi:hypothetical protein